MSTLGFQLDSAELVGTCVESVLYGAAFLTTVQTILGFHARQSRGDHVRLVFRIAPWILITIATLHISVDWFRVIYAFIQLPGREERVPFLIDTASWSYAMKDDLFTFQVWLGDAIVLYKAYIIWNYNWPVLVIPTVSYVVTFASGIGVMVAESQADNVFAGRLKTIISISLISMVLTTAYCTGVVLYRIYSGLRRFSALLGKSQVDSTYPDLIFVICQSAVTYTTCLIVMYGLFQANSNAEFIFRNLMCSLISLLFNNVTGAQRRTSPTSTGSGGTSLRGNTLQFVTTPGMSRTEATSELDASEFRLDRRSKAARSDPERAERGEGDMYKSAFSVSAV